MKRRFYISDVFCALCVTLAILAAISGGALGVLIGTVVLGTGLLLSLAQRILVGIRLLETQGGNLPRSGSALSFSGGAGYAANNQRASALKLSSDEQV